MPKQIALFCFILLLSGCHKKALAPKVHSFPVEVATVQREDTPIFIEALGHIESITSIDIYSRVQGELTGVYFKQGQEVKKGDLLFTIDPRPYQATLKEAKGALDKSEAELALSEEKVKRYRTLTRDSYFSQMDYETLQSEMAANRALVMENQAKVENAKISLDYCWIYAPHDGKMGILNIDYGNLICPTCETPLVTLNQMDPIFITFSIPEYQLPRIQKAMHCQDSPLQIQSTFESFEEGERFEGQLDIVNNAVDPASGMMKFRALFSNEHRSLWPGQFIRNRLILSIMKNALLIPMQAVQMTQTDPIVFVLKEDMTVEQRTVLLGQRENGKVIILKGLNPDEQIITEGQINLFSGAHVHVQRRS